MKPAPEKSYAAAPAAAKIESGRLCPWRPLPYTTTKLHHDKSYFGDKYRRLRARLGAPKAITAMAHQLARIIWTLITRQLPFDLNVFAHHEKAHQQRRLKHLAATARQMGYQLTPVVA
jgi:transposase